MSMSEDLESQQHELLALASIYDDDEFHRDASAQGGEMHVCLELPPDFKVVVKKGTTESTEYNISFLPHLTVHFQLPPEYPSSSAPRFSLSAAWLSRAQLSSLRRRLDRLWEENRGSVVLFAWFTFLKEEALGFLGVRSPLEIVGERSSSILPQLLDFDETHRQKAFSREAFCCAVCFAEKPGSVCLRFEACRHVYCKACVTRYFKIQIRKGNVQCLGCPTPKCSSAATPWQVKQLVDEKLFARYDRLLLQSALDRMEDVVYCPRKSCASAVWLEPESTIGVCSTCCFAFCVFCKRAYHPVATCIRWRKLKDEYLSKGKVGKKLMEKHLGKRPIQMMLEESFSADWVDENCKPCPHCGVNIHKGGGCDNMKCESCGGYFYWSRA